MAVASAPDIGLGSNLDRDQLAAVCAERRALSILAGAGAGKTRVLTHRVAWLAGAREIQPERILAVSFTNQAVDEMRGRLGELIGAQAASEVECSTFHAAAWRLVVRPYRRKFARPVSVIYSAEDSLSACRRAITEAGMSAKADEVLARIALAKALRQSPNALLTGTASEREVGLVWLAYREALREAGALDFEDIIGSAVWLLEEEAEVRDAIQGRFDAVLVDEYQDASPCQRRWVELVSGTEGWLSVVGDEDQLLYGWRGADAVGLVGFCEQYASRGAGRVVLGRNYRSGEAIVTAAASLIRHNPARWPKELRATERGGSVEFRHFAEETSEVEGVVAWIAARLEEGVEGSEIAVLARTGRGLVRAEQLLASRAIPYELVGKLRLAEHAEIRDVLSLISAARYPHHREAIARAARRVKGLGVRSVERAFAQARSEERAPLEVIGEIARLDPRIGAGARAGCTELAVRVEAVKDALRVGLRAGVVCAVKASGWGAELAAGEPEEEPRRERIRMLAELAGRLEAEGERDAEVLLVRLVLSESRDGSDHMGVTLSSIHAAKGREWERVWLIGATEGGLPHYRSLGSDAEIAAERCVAYVAMTRARRELVVSAPEWAGRPPREQRVSRFVSEAGLTEVDGAF